MNVDREAVSRALAGAPAGVEDAGGPVFGQPWQARAFAMVLALQEQDVFTWPQWSATLGDEIQRAQAAGDPDSGETYYSHWLAALERLVSGSGLAGAETVRSYRHAWARAAERTPHGSPVELRPEDFGVPGRPPAASREA
ncbi:MAG: nitrile hydratase accessory protein [Acidimicrobiales bacterium]